jgi:hypothetical protein
MQLDMDCTELNVRGNGATVGASNGIISIQNFVKLIWAHK